MVRGRCFNAERLRRRGAEREAGVRSQGQESGIFGHGEQEKQEMVA